MQEELQLLVDLHKDGARQGPGGEVETRLALTLSGLSPSEPLQVADLGCGSGAATLVLARQLEARVTAVDLMPEFLARLDAEAVGAGVADRIETHQGSMAALPFPEGTLDAIWSEGAVYNMGFDAGITAWRRHLKPGGVLAVSELTWLTAERPAEIQDHWQNAYPEVDTSSAKIALLERRGYRPLGYFVLPDHCWLENYYRPLERRFEPFLEAHGHSEAARAIVESEKQEIDLYERFRAFVGYGFYIARKMPD